jgi:hypothetical protein
LPVKTAAWFESRFDLLQTGEAREQQADGDQQNERQRALRDEQARAQRPPEPTDPRPFLQRFLHVDPAACTRAAGRSPGR